MQKKKTRTCKMKKKKYPKLEDFDFSDYKELTGAILFKINGGAKIENSNEAVANAQVGDVLERKDGTVVEITQGDIDWAKEYVGSNGGGTEGSADGGSDGNGGAEEIKVVTENSSVGTGSNSGGSYNNEKESS